MAVIVLLPFQGEIFPKLPSIHLTKRRVVPYLKREELYSERRCDMKKILAMVITAVFMSITGSAIAADISNQEAYICKVEARKCMDNIQTAQAKVQKLNESVEKGSVYSPADIDKIQKLIKELNDTLDKTKPAS
jgi:hypothetical protein